MKRFRVDYLVIDHNISISKYNFVTGSTCIRLQK